MIREKTALSKEETALSRIEKRHQNYWLKAQKQLSVMTKAVNKW